MATCLSMLLLVATIFVSSCGSSGNGDDGDSSNAPPNPDEDVPIDSPPPPGEMISFNNARAFAIDALEVNDILEFAGRVLPATIGGFADSSGNCASQGTYSIERDEMLTTAQLTNCDLINGKTVSLSGTLTINVQSGDFSTEKYTAILGYQNFNATRENRTVMIDGSITITANPNSDTLSANELMLNDSQGDITFAELSTVVTHSAGQTSERSLDYVASFSRFLDAPITIQSPSLKGNNAACPTEGKVTVTAEDNTSLSITASGSESMLVEVGDNSETINCTEVAVLLEQDGFEPPPAP